MYSEEVSLQKETMIGEISMLVEVTFFFFSFLCLMHAVTWKETKIEEEMDVGRDKEEG